MSFLFVLTHFATLAIAAAQGTTSSDKDDNSAEDRASMHISSRVLFDVNNDDTRGDVTLGLILILGSLLCMGTWSTLLRLCTVFTGIVSPSTHTNLKGKFGCTHADATTVHKERFGQNRHPCHVYLDYAVSYVVVGSLILPALASFIHYAEQMALETDRPTAVGSTSDNSTGAGPNEVMQMTRSSSSWLLVLTALLGGSLLAIGNLTTQWATTAFGAPLTTVLALQASMCVSIGTYWNYRLQPERTSSPFLLMLGVSMFIVAIICSVYAQSGYQQEKQNTSERRKALDEEVRREDEPRTGNSTKDTGGHDGESKSLHHFRTMSSSSATSAILGAGDDSTTGFSLPPYTGKAGNAPPASTGTAYQKAYQSHHSLSNVSDEDSCSKDRHALKHSESTHSIGSYGSVNATFPKLSGSPEVAFSSSPFNVIVEMSLSSDFNDDYSGPPPQNIEGIPSTYYPKEFSEARDSFRNSSNSISLAAVAAESAAATSNISVARGGRRSFCHVPSCLQLPVHQEEEEEEGTNVHSVSQTVNEPAPAQGRTFVKQVSMLKDTDDDPCDCRPFAQESADIMAASSEKASIDEEMSLLAETLKDGNAKADRFDQVKTKNVTIGILVAVLGGLCFGFFSPLFNISVNDPFRWSNSNNEGLMVSTANSLFAIAFTMSSIVWNVYLMAYPPKVGEIIVEPSTLSQYICRDPLSERLLAFAAGGLCSIANALQFQGGELAGFAASDMVQAFPLVATVWDVIVFGEFRSASWRILWLLAAMYAAYIGGMICLASSVTL